MTNSATISFANCPEDIERADFISSRDGNNERTFRCSVDVRTAVHQAGILTDGTESLIDARWTRARAAISLSRRSNTATSMGRGGSKNPFEVARRELPPSTSKNYSRHNCRSIMQILQTDYREARLSIPQLLEP
jgi:hypothetical protein